MKGNGLMIKRWKIDTRWNKNKKIILKIIIKYTNKNKILIKNIIIIKIKINNKTIILIKKINEFF